MRVTWSREARENLIEIEAFIGRDSLKRAVQFVDALIDHASGILTDNPRSGRVVAEIGHPDMRELICRGYRIVCRLRGDALDILAVFEGDRQLRLNEPDD